MKVCGNNDDYRLGGSLNNITDQNKDIKSPCKSRLEVSTLLSFSSFVQSVWINQNGEAFAVGPNGQGKISSTLQKKKLEKDTKIDLHYKSGKPCKFISAVAGSSYTLYQVLNETDPHKSQLILAHSDEDTIFLNTGKRSPLSLFGGSSTSAAIDTEGSVIIITKSVFDSPTSEIEALNLPGSEKAVKLACCDESVIALSENGRVYECSLKSKKKSFIEVKELSKIKINEISGTSNHFLAIAIDGSVYGRGSNNRGKLGIPDDVGDLEEFKVINSLSKYKIVDASAGNFDSLFRTSEGKIIGCGWNVFDELMIPSNDRSCMPTETLITKGATFCISGSHTSIVFVDVEPPPNTPNRKIVKFPSSTSGLPPRTKTGSTDEITELRKLLEMKDKEILSLKAENSSLKKKLDESQKRINEIEKKKEQALDIIDTETMDKLKKIKSLGRGATSEVFEVIREEKLALKVYYPEIFNDDDDDEDNEEKVARNTASMRKFLLEYESINQLDHKNIIKAFGIYFGDEEHAPSILLEYCVSNLKKKIKKLTNSERIRAIVDISSAMKEVHSVGIIHRDLKLENILLDEENNVKLSDFGLCTLMTVENESKTRTQMTGTLKYMAPELLNESTDYDEKVDVYAFGVVVFLILTKGEFPKIGFSDILHGKKADIPSSITHFSKELINKCWSFKASDRPSFAEIYDSLNKNESKLI